jgi:hypothetical protein
MVTWFIVILSVVAAGVWAALARRSWVAALQLRRMQESMVSRPLAALDIGLAFDTDLAIVWDTQVPALELIAAGKDSGIRRRSLRATYKRLAQNYPELYEGSTFEQWLQHLEQAELIVCRGSRVMLAPEGRVFLRCRVTAPPKQPMPAMSTEPIPTGTGNKLRPE